MAEHQEVQWAYGVIYDDLRACGCGRFDDRLKLLRQLLQDCPLYEGVPKWDSALAEWFLCLATAADLIEHGGSIGGSWITEKGKRLLAVLEDEAAVEKLGGDPVGYCPCVDCVAKGG